MSENQIATFGLPTAKDGGTARERAEIRATTISKGEMFLGALFRHLSTVLGQRKARELFAPFAPKPSRGKRIDPDRDAHLFLVHDLLCEQIPDRAAVPRIAAIGLHAAAPGKYGNSAAAIEKQIRRLANEREAARKLAEDMVKVCQVELSNVKSLFTDK